MGFGVQGVFSVGFDDKIGHSIGFKTGLTFQFSVGFRLKDQCASLRSAHKIFQKKKKEKKESRLTSGGFKKVKFFYKKILPDSSLAAEA